MAGISLNINIKGDTNLLQGLMERLQDLSPVTKDMGERMRFSVEENFRTGGRPVLWAKLAPATIKARARKGLGPTPVLIGWSAPHMKDTFNYRAGSDRLVIGFADPKAIFHQLGTKKMPARSPLVVQDADLAYLTKSLQEFLTK